MVVSTRYYANLTRWCGAPVWRELSAASEEVGGVQWSTMEDEGGLHSCERIFHNVCTYLIYSFTYIVLVSVDIFLCTYSEHYSIACTFAWSAGCTRPWLTCVSITTCVFAFSYFSFHFTLFSVPHSCSPSLIPLLRPSFLFSVPHSGSPSLIPVLRPSFLFSVPPSFSLSLLPFPCLSFIHTYVSNLKVH